jgi:lipid II:glycine glycyltransferase (peptidoglycan interpeptide bridge formation enzyme)
LKLEIINPIEYPDWDNMLREHEDASFFHTSAWAKVLHESYNYKPLYFTVIENGKLVSLIPLMEVKSFLTGIRGVSLPFTDHCPLVCNDPVNLEDILNSIIEYGKTAGWKHIDLRGDNAYFNGKPASASFFVHFLDLSQGKDEIFSEFRDSTKRNIKHARKENVEIKIDNSWPAVETFFQLHCGTRKHHGLPPQPRYFFQKIFERIIAKDKGFVALAYRQKKAIAGAVFFHFKNQAIYKYGASDRNHLNLRPNNLVMWKAIEWYAENGFKSFSFGRTEPENDGLLQFKRGWGAEEKSLSYYKYDLNKDSFVSDKSGVKSSYNFLKMMPISMLRIAGNFLYRHVG